MNVFVQQANALTVTDGPSSIKAANFLREIKTVAKKVNDTFDDLIADAHSAHKKLVARKREFTEPLNRAEAVLKGRIGEYQMEEERKRREEEARLRREQEAKAAAEAARLRAIEEERRLNEAAALEAAGQKEEADAILEAPVIVEVPVAPVIVAPVAPKLDGVSSRTVWKYRIVDAAQLPRQFLMPDESAIRGTVLAQKGLTKIPGVEVYPEASVSARSY